MRGTMNFSVVFGKVSDAVSAATGSPFGLLGAILAAVVSWVLAGFEFTVLWITVLTWWQLFPLQHAQSKDTKEVKVLLHGLVEQLGEVDERQVAARVDEEVE